MIVIYIDVKCTKGEYLKMRWIILILSIMLFYVWEGAPEDTKKEIIESLSKIQYEFTKLDTRITSNKLSEFVDKFSIKENNSVLVSFETARFTNLMIVNAVLWKKIIVQSSVDEIQIYKVLINNGNCKTATADNAKFKDFGLAAGLSPGDRTKRIGDRIKYGEYIILFAEQNCSILNISLDTSQGRYLLNKNEIKVREINLSGDNLYQNEKNDSNNEQSNETSE